MSYFLETPHHHHHSKTSQHWKKFKMVDDIAIVGVVSHFKFASDVND